MTSPHDEGPDVPPDGIPHDEGPKPTLDGIPHDEQPKPTLDGIPHDEEPAVPPDGIPHDGGPNVTPDGIPHEEEPAPASDDIRRDEEDGVRAEDLFYANVVEFFTDRLCHLLSPPPPGSGRVWCPEWYRHAQAVSRLDAVWRAWEMLRFDGALGISNWWLHHADPHWRALTDPVTGPFAHCADGHGTAESLPHVPPPEGIFTDQRQWRSRDPFALD
ncbi:DUF4913 domain-containing protein [Streptomyces sp. XM83C]|uniref:DUF4913 domain-containing protein n=1 Tax=unclassified Streptomyces TaxID=2593676 RepID=UPI001FF91CBE|nr:DUF4913 domain-containing protein [Streptomyces sp. XM83C]MCK1820963.1 DUF4913 domain-containing protein [Streptomyces sp. XM83C]